MAASLEIKINDRALQRLAERARQVLGRRPSFKPLLNAIKGEMVTSTARRFETGTAPDGSRWRPSLAALAKRRQTLINDGHLRDSISETPPVVTPTSVEIGTNVPYAGIHQFGATIPPHTIRARRARALAIPGIGFRRSVKHPGGTIHARPFLGLSAQDETVIHNLTEDWMRKITARLHHA